MCYPFSKLDKVFHRRVNFPPQKPLPRGQVSVFNGNS